MKEEATKDLEKFSRKVTSLQFSNIFFAIYTNKNEQQLLPCIRENLKISKSHCKSIFYLTLDLPKICLEMPITVP